MALPSFPDKDPGEKLDYTIDWTNRLIGADTISAVTWDVPAGLTKESQNNDTSKAVIWLSGGTEKTSYTLTCKVTTQNGRIMEQSVKLKVVSK